MNQTGAQIGSPPGPANRVRAFGYFVIAAIYFLFAQMVAHSIGGFFFGMGSELAERGTLLVLLLAGYSFMGRAFEGQRRPLEAMGLVRRPSGLREFGLGAALGWGMLVVSILPLALIGGMVITFWTAPHQFLVLGLDLVVLAIAALAEEVAFRGYPFQRLIDAIGPVLATLVLAGLFGLAHIFNPEATHTSVTVTVFCGWLLSIAYLRTHALWLSWGWHFAWNASMGILFGLPISGLTRFSPVIQTNTIGPTWITGGDYGPEASLVAAFVILAGIIVLLFITRDYAHQYAQEAILPQGVSPAFHPANPDPHTSAPAGERPAGDFLASAPKPDGRTDPIPTGILSSDPAPDPPHEVEGTKKQAEESNRDESNSH